MSIASAKAALRAILLTITADYGNGPLSLAKVYDRPKEATSIGEFPVAIISLAPQTNHTAREETAGAVGLLRHDYTLRIWLIVGTRQTPIHELTSRVEAWIEPLLIALADNLTLNGAVQHIGNGEDILATYMETPIQWGLTENEQAFYGLKIDLPITEMISTPMEP